MGALQFPCKNVSRCIVCTYREYCSNNAKDELWKKERRRQMAMTKKDEGVEHIK